MDNKLVALSKILNDFLRVSGQENLLKELESKHECTPQGFPKHSIMHELAKSELSSDYINYLDLMPIVNVSKVDNEAAFFQTSDIFDNS